MNSLLLAALLLLPAAARAQGVTDAERSTPVPAGPARPYQLAPAQKATLANGMKLAVVQSVRLPVVALELALPYGGSALDPQGREGLAGLVSALMSEGAGTRDADAFAEALADLGAGVSASADADTLTVSVFARKENLDQVLALVADMVRRPTLPEDALARLREETAASIAADRGDPAKIAGRALAARVFPDHPYGRSLSEASIGAVTRDDAVAYAARAADPRGAVLAAAGDISLDELKAMAERHFGDWAASGALPVLPMVVTEPKRRGGSAANRAAAPLIIDLYDLPGSEQSALRLGQTSIKRDDPDFYAMRLMMEILGGGTGRLHQNIREAKGWAYGAYASLSPFRQAGLIEAETDVQTDHTADAIREMFAEMDRMRTDLVPDEELQKAKNYAAGGFLRRQEKVQGVAGQTAAAELNRLPPDELARYREKLMAVTADQVREAARKHLRPDSVSIVIAGDAEKVYESLTSLGTVRVFNPDGTPKPAPQPKQPGNG